MGTIYFKRHELTHDRDKEYPLTEELERNLTRLIKALNSLREEWGRAMLVNSGYRPGPYNSKVGGAKNSAHLTCEAADISDPMGMLSVWLLENIDVLTRCGLYLENPDKTPGWVHVQTRIPKSGRRVFNP